MDLARRIEELSVEIRNYPTPIARCDEQLTALIEERSRLMSLLNKNQCQRSGCTPESIWANEGGHAA